MKLLTKSIFVLALAVSITPAFAETSSCLDIDESKKVTDQFAIESHDPDEKWDACDKKDLARSVIGSILFMKNLPAATNSGPSPFDYNVIAPSPVAFFSSRIQRITLESARSSKGTCDEFTLAYVKGGHNGTLHACPALAETSDVLMSAAALIHESRHQDGNGFPHAVCEHGAFAGMGGAAACDQRYSDQGSYGIETEFFVKVSRTRGVDPAARQAARAKAIEFFMDRFNELPLGIERGALLVNEAGSSSFYNGEKLTPVPAASEKDTQWMLGGDVLYAFDSKSSGILASHDGSLWESTGWRKERDLVDYYSDPAMFCALYTDELLCSSPMTGRVEIKFNGFRATGFASHAIDGPVTQNAAYIATTTDDVYYLPLTDEGAPKITSGSELPKSNDFSGVDAFARLDSSHLILLDKKGSVMLAPLGSQIKSDTPTTAAPGIQPSRHFKKMLAPYYWSPILKDL